MTVFFAVMAVVVWLWKRRQARIGPQEARFAAGNVRVPPSVGTRKRPRAPGAWALYIAIPLGGLMLVCFVVMKVVYGYDAAILMDRGQRATATVTISGLPREDCHYQFSVENVRYNGRGPASLDAGQSLSILYEAANPRRNRPADGLWGDIAVAGGVGGGAIVILMLPLLSWINGRRPKPAWAGELEGALAAADFEKARQLLGSTELGKRSGGVLLLADAITATCGARGEAEIYERGERALVAMMQGVTDPAIQKELGSYRKELDASRQIAARSVLSGQPA